MTKKKENKASLDLKEILVNSKEKIQEGLSEMIMEELKESISYRFRDELEEVVKEFFEKEIKPEIKKRLISNAASILNGLFKAINEIGKELSKKMTETAFERIKDMDSYNFEEIMKRIF